MALCSHLVWTLIALLCVVVVILALAATDLLCEWSEGEERYGAVATSEVPLNNSYVAGAPVDTVHWNRTRRVHFTGPENAV
jgi:hypothetical protein